MAYLFAAYEGTPRSSATAADRQRFAVQRRAGGAQPGGGGHRRDQCRARRSAAAALYATQRVAPVVGRTRAGRPADQLTLRAQPDGLRESTWNARPAGRSGRTAQRWLLNLDRFKYINNSLGYELGDHLLVSVTGRLRGILSRRRDAGPVGRGRVRGAHAGTDLDNSRRRWRPHGRRDRKTHPSRRPADRR